MGTDFTTAPHALALHTGRRAAPWKSLHGPAHKNPDTPLRSYVFGWKGYFKLAETPNIWKRLDEWLRHRLRAIQLKHWKRGKTMYRELIQLGAPPLVVRQVAANSRRWWRNADRLLKTVLTIAYFDRLGVPRLS